MMVVVVMMVIMVMIILMNAILEVTISVCSPGVRVHALAEYRVPGPEDREHSAGQSGQVHSPLKPYKA